MKIIVACEYSQVVTAALRKRGHEAYSCDVLPTEGDPSWHIQDGILQHLQEGWDMIIAFPPCTYLCNSGVCWLHERPDRWELMREACDFFNSLLSANIPRIALENPIQHKYARQYIRPPDQIIQPYHFGERESKATCLWLKGLPPLMATYTGADNIKQSCYKQGPSSTRGKIRSRTFQGIAEAMAAQWG